MHSHSHGEDSLKKDSRLSLEQFCSWGCRSTFSWWDIILIKMTLRPPLSPLAHTKRKKEWVVLLKTWKRQLFFVRILHWPFAKEKNKPSIDPKASSHPQRYTLGRCCRFGQQRRVLLNPLVLFFFIARLRCGMHILRVPACRSGHNVLNSKNFDWWCNCEYLYFNCMNVVWCLWFFRLWRWCLKRSWWSSVVFHVSKIHFYKHIDETSRHGFY